MCVSEDGTQEFSSIAVATISSAATADRNMQNLINIELANEFRGGIKNILDIGQYTMCCFDRQRILGT